MSKLSDLRDWTEEAKKAGLVDVKFVVGPDADALVLLRGDPREQDITNETF